MKHSIKIISLCSLFTLLSGCGGNTSPDDPNNTNNDPNANPAAPVLATIGNKIVALGDTLQFTVSATDPNNLSLAYATDGSDSRANPYTETGGLASFNTNTRQFNWNTAGVATGDYIVEFSVMNSAALSDSETIRIWIQTDPVQFEAGQTLYNNSCKNSGCHNNEDTNQDEGARFPVLCLTENEVKTVTENPPGVMASINFNFSSSEEAAISYYLLNVRPDDC